MPCRGLRFLVVEDHEFQRRAMVQLLQTLGAPVVHAAEDGRAALQVLRDPDRPVDIVVSDLSMPGMDGMEFVRHLSEAGTKVSLILASALDTELLASVAHMAAAYKVKLLGVIGKPPTARKLVPLIELHRSKTPSVPSPDSAFSFEEIAEAWTHKEFEPWFLPRVELVSGKVCGMAAVPRWRHPSQGLLEQESFLPSVVARGLDDDFGWMMIQKCTAACQQWVQSGLDVPVAVTLSLSSLTDTDLAVRIRQIARNHGLEPRYLTLNVTEDLLAKASQARALENLARLRVDGFGLGIDDFGTGPLALEQLSVVAFTEIRINSSFVTGVHRKDGDRAGLAVGLQVAHELKLRAVADGVSSKDEWKLLKEWGCDIGQGPFISDPVAADEVLAWARGWSKQTIR